MMVRGYTYQGGQISANQWKKNFGATYAAINTKYFSRGEVTNFIKTMQKHLASARIMTPRQSLDEKVAGLQSGYPLKTFDAPY